MKGGETRTMDPIFFRFATSSRLGPEKNPSFRMYRPLDGPHWQMRLLLDKTGLLDGVVTSRIRDYRLSPVKAIPPPALLALLSPP